MGRGETNIKWFDLIQKILGFLIGFFFWGIAFDRIIGFMQGGMTALPAEIPSWFNLILAGGTLGLFVIVILLIIGIKVVQKFANFVKWILIGIFAALIVNTVFPALSIPNPFEWIGNQLGIAGAFNG